MVTGDEPAYAPLERLLSPLEAGRRRALRLRQRSRRRRLWFGSILAAMLVAGSAIAAITYLGQPAPRKVKQAFQRDNNAQGGSTDAPLHVPLVDPNSAETVAVSGRAVLYAAQGKGGYYCTVLVWDGKAQRTPSVRCEFGVWPLAMRLDYKRFVWTKDAAAPLVFSGRLSRRGRSLTARYADGVVDRVAIGLRGYFVYQPVAGLQRIAKTSAVRLIERDRRGTITDTQVAEPPLVVSAQPRQDPKRITGRVFEPNARYVVPSLFVRVSPGLFVEQGPQQVLPLIAGGRFTWRASHLANRNYWVSFSVLDSHFQHIVDDIEIG
jgi:hypothetical protein